MADIIDPASVEQEEDAAMHPRIRSFVTTEEEFRAAVERGRSSAKKGASIDFETMMARLDENLSRR